jgi:succinate dehydrogenase / fumarate reductase membrane anchor subunit
MRVFQLQRISAIGMVVFMTMHMIVVHYPPFHIDFSIILERMQNPVWKVVEILFLFFVLVHALSGMYAVLIDYEKVARYKKLIAVIALVAGIVGFLWGTLTVLAWQPPA